MKSLTEIPSTEKLDHLDYLIVGHITKDRTPQGETIGGTVAYAGRTALAHGLRVGALTSFAADIDLNPLHGMQIHNLPSEHTTTFENRYTPHGREQYVHNIAGTIHAADVPEIWQPTPILHLGPLANEVNWDLIELFADTFIGLTPQGWLRAWNHKGKVYLLDWETIRDILPLASAVVISLEDIDNDAQVIPAMAEECRLLAVTEGANGAWVYYQGQERHFLSPRLKEIDPTGAGDIFATVFFIHFQRYQDPWEAAQIATYIASRSVTQVGIESTPSKEEVQIQLVKASR